MFRVQNDRAQRTIRVRLCGYIREAEMREFAEAYRSATDEYAGRPHFVLADMRGMGANGPAAAAVLGEVIAYARARGVICCAHLSDEGVARLQMRRLGRHASEGTEVIVEAISLREAEEILNAARAALAFAPRPDHETEQETEATLPSEVVGGGDAASGRRMRTSVRAADPHELEPSPVSA